MNGLSITGLRVNGSQPYSKSLFARPDLLPIEQINKWIKFPISNITMQDPGVVGNTSFGCSTLMSHDIHTGKCIRRFAGTYAYCWYFIDRKW